MHDKNRATIEQRSPKAKEKSSSLGAATEEARWWQWRCGEWGVGESGEILGWRVGGRMGRQGHGGRRPTSRLFCRV